MKSFKQFLPFISKSPTKTMSCYRGYQLGFKEGSKKVKELEDKLKQLDHERMLKSKPWMKQESCYDCN